MANATGCLLVIRLHDAYTWAPARDPKIKVSIDGPFAQPVRKPDGLFVFLQVPEGTYTVRVQSEAYHDETLEVSTASLDPKNPVVMVLLSPSPIYPFAEGATLIRTTLRDGNNRPAADVSIRAVVTTESCAKARLAQDIGQTGESEISLNRVMGRLQNGGRFLLQESDGSAREVCLLQETADGTRQYPLAAPLQQAYHRGALLLPVVETRSDERGEVVLPFGNYRTRIFEVQIEFVSVDGTKVVKEVNVQEGQMNGLGVVQLG